MNNFEDFLKEVLLCLKKEKKLIHCLTNPISINDMANVILSLGASPFMADNSEESQYITENADALLINIGNITSDRIKAIIKSQSAANEKDIPVVLDMVGVGASNLRLNLVKDILENGNVSLIKGNYSEIEALRVNRLTSSSVDAERNDFDRAYDSCRLLSEKYSCMVLATGKQDIAVSEGQSYKLENGVDKLSKVTGTGCIVGAICAVMLSCKVDLRSVIAAVSIMNISGERCKSEGMGSFRVELIDEISLMTAEKIMERIKWEKI